MSARAAPGLLPQPRQAIAEGRRGSLPRCRPTAPDEQLWVCRPMGLEHLQPQRRPQGYRQHQYPQPRWPVVAPVLGRRWRAGSVAARWRRACGRLPSVGCLVPRCWNARCLSLIGSLRSYALLRCWSRTRSASESWVACPKTWCAPGCCPGWSWSDSSSPRRCRRANAFQPFQPRPLGRPSHRSRSLRPRRSCHSRQWLCPHRSCSQRWR